VRAEGRVKWVRRFPEAAKPSGMGVEFEHIDEDDRAALQRFLEAYASGA
jgi:hypothetical protein